MKGKSIIKIFIIVIAAVNLGCNNNHGCSSIGNDSKNIFNLKDSLKRAYNGESYSKKQLELFLNDSTENLLKGKILINDKQILIKIAEPILFKIYGEENIKEQRPYEIYLFGDYWIMNGTMPLDMKGGTFTIAINRKSCEIVGITHGK